jgi:hypothetical protein
MTVLALATLVDMTQIGSRWIKNTTTNILGYDHFYWPRQVRKAISHHNMDGVIALNFANGNIASLGEKTSFLHFSFRQENF